MSAVDVAHAPPIAEERSLSGWGRVNPSRCSVLRPCDVEDVVEAFSLCSRPGAGVIARGAGRSYGDAAQNGGGCVLDMTGWREILEIDGERGLLTAQAGATIAELMSALADRGLTLPVVPGTRHVTLAGAIASDVHGKNHHRDGAFARHVAALSLYTPGRGLLELSPKDDPDLFYATFGGMGLTGVILQATLRTEPLPSPWVAADVDRTDGLEQTLELMTGDERSRYSVAWLDLLADGARMGRAVISRADPMPAQSAPRHGRWARLERMVGLERTAGGVSANVRRVDGAEDAGSTAFGAESVPANVAGSSTRPGRMARPGHGGPPGHLRRRPLVEVPRGFPAALLRPSGMRAFNRLRWHAAPRRERGRPVALGSYFFPLDGLGAWNRLYGPAGLVQYQLVVPAGDESALVSCFESIRARRLPVYLAVFKRFGPCFGGPLSFPLEGWTLAIDVPAAAPGLGRALDALDAHVASCGGRVYLAKDIRLRPETLRAMYPRLDGFHAQRARVDPQEVLRSDLARRLELCASTR